MTHKEILEELRNSVNVENHTTFGEMNIILQVIKDDGEETYTVDNYMPRKNIVASLDGQTREEVIVSVKDTIERMKVGINLMQDFVDGKIDNVYYWEEEE